MCDQWPREKTLDLIEAYRSKECLWKVSSEGYSDRKERNDAWEEVAMVVGCDVRSAEKKIKTLRTQFMSCYKQAKKKRCETGQIHRPKWFAYGALQFLIQKRAARENRDSVGNGKKVAPMLDETLTNSLYATDAEEEREEDRKPLNSLLECSFDIEDEAREDRRRPTNGFGAREEYDARCGAKNGSNATAATTTTTTTPTTSKMLKSREEPETNWIERSIESPWDEKASNLMRSFREHLNRDACTIFGEYVACRLKNISNQYVRAIVEHQINNIFFEAEMGRLPPNPKYSNIELNLPPPSHCNYGIPRSPSAAESAVSACGKNNPATTHPRFGRSPRGQDPKVDRENEHFSRESCD